MPRACSSLLCGALLAVAIPARAHDPPVCLDVRWRSDTLAADSPMALDARASEAVCLSNRGMVFADAETGEWRLACSKALGIPSTEVPDLYYAPDGRLLVATSAGLQATSDGGCTWEFDPAFASVNTTALVQDPTNPARFLLTTGGRVDEPDQLYESTDGGRTWSSVAPIAKGEFYEELLIAPSDPQRVYAAATAFGVAAATLTRFVARSTDGGATWERIDQTLAPSETALRALAVHPTDADKIVFSVGASERTDPDRLILSRDAGRTFTNALGAPKITSASFSTDGDALWVTALSAARDPGLWRSTDLGATFEAIDGPAYMGCVFERAGQLDVCGRWARELAFGGVAVAEGPDGAFEARMQFEEVCDSIACARGSAAVAACADLWLDWQYEINGCTGVYGNLGAPSGVTGPAASTSACGCPGEPDAGAPSTPADAGGGAGPAVASPPAATNARARAGCSCSAPASGAHGTTPLAAALWMSFAVRWTRRRRHVRAGVAPTLGPGV